MFHASSEIEAALERPADEIHASVRPPVQAVEEKATATPRRMEPLLPTSPRRVTPRGMSLRTEPFLRRSEKLRTAAGRQLSHGSGFIHGDAAWVLGATAIAIVLGFLIAHL
jgi:hypothetical protein